MDAKKKIGIVTVLYNSANVLKEFFESLERSTYRNFILYAIENSSPDSSLALVKDLAAKASFQTKVIESGANVGVAKGNNIGIERALQDGCDLILLANNDIEFSPDAIQQLLDAMEQESCELAVPKIFNFFTGKLWFAGGGYGLIFPTKHYGAGQPDAPQFNVRRACDYAPTCFMMIKREVFEKSGLMDEKYFAYFDDTDFVRRAVMRDKFKLIYEPKSVVQHKVSNSSGGKFSVWSLHMNLRNGAYFMNKFMPWYRRWCVVGYQFTYYFLYSLKYPKFPGFPTHLKFYREGLKMYREWVEAGKPNDMRI